MANFNAGMGGMNRNIFNHGAGKGSKPRHKQNDSFRANFDAIQFPHSEEGFENRAGKKTKRYGTLRNPVKLVFHA
jgi:hypothetical protein